jgi:hypothetical protein
MHMVLVVSVSPCCSLAVCRPPIPLPFAIFSSPCRLPSSRPPAICHLLTPVPVIPIPIPVGVVPIVAMPSLLLSPHHLRGTGMVEVFAALPVPCHVILWWCRHPPLCSSPSWLAAMVRHLGVVWVWSQSLPIPLLVVVAVLVVPIVMVAMMAVVVLVLVVIQSFLVLLVVIILRRLVSNN